MITANSRVRLTADDFDFIVRALSLKESDRVSLEKLLTDVEVRDEILDLDALADAVLEAPGRLSISPHLLFYVLCRRVLKGSAVSSRESADYVAAMLEAFSRTTRVFCPDGTGFQPSEYLSDMLQALSKAGERESFLLRSHMANYSLFVSGMFSENVEKRNGRGAPDISFYEKMGGMNYRVAAEYREAKRFNLQSIYEELSRGFHDVRLALNDLAGRLLHIDSPRVPIIIT
jgi:hypothetical protein